MKAKLTQKSILESEVSSREELHGILAVYPDSLHFQSIQKMKEK